MFNRRVRNLERGNHGSESKTIVGQADPGAGALLLFRDHQAYLSQLYAAGWQEAQAQGAASPAPEPVINWPFSTTAQPPVARPTIDAATLDRLFGQPPAPGPIYPGPVYPGPPILPGQPVPPRQTIDPAELAWIFQPPDRPQPDRNRPLSLAERLYGPDPVNPADPAFQAAPPFQFKGRSLLDPRPWPGPGTGSGSGIPSSMNPYSGVLPAPEMTPPRQAVTEKESGGEPQPGSRRRMKANLGRLFGPGINLSEEKVARYEESIAGFHRQVDEFARQQLKPIVDDFVDWAKHNDITPEGIERLIRKGPGWLMGGKNIERVIKDTWEELKKVDYSVVATDAVMAAALAVVMVVVTGGGAAILMAVAGIARLGLTAAASSVLSQMGKSALVRTGVPPEAADTLIYALDYRSTIRSQRRFGDGLTPSPQKGRNGPLRPATVRMDLNAR